MNAHSPAAIIDNPQLLTKELERLCRMVEAAKRLTPRQLLWLLELKRAAKLRRRAFPVIASDYLDNVLQYEVAGRLRLDRDPRYGLVGGKTPVSLTGEATSRWHKLIAVFVFYDTERRLPPETPNRRATALDNACDRIRTLADRKFQTGAIGMRKFTDSSLDDTVREFEKMPGAGWLAEVPGAAVPGPQLDPAIVDDVIERFVKLSAVSGALMGA